MAEKPSEVFGRRLKYYRQRRSWSQDDLARELDRVGRTIDRAQITRMENGKRGISLDDAIEIAWALGLPPALLYLPLGEADDIALAPDVHVHPDLARKWVIGAEPSTDSARYARMPGEWKADMAVWWWHDELDKAVRRVRDAARAVRSAEYVGNVEQLEGAKLEHVAALQELAGVLDEMRGRGWLVPEIHYQMAEDMRLAAITYDGPTFDPDQEEK